MAFLSVLLFSASAYHPFFTVLGLLLGAAALGLGYGALWLLRHAQASPDTGGKAFHFVAGVALLGGMVIVVGLAALCAGWVAG